MALIQMQKEIKKRPASIRGARRRKAGEKSKKGIKSSIHQGKDKDKTMFYPVFPKNI